MLESNPKYRLPNWCMRDPILTGRVFFLYIPYGFEVLKNSTAIAVKNTSPTPFHVNRKIKNTLGLRPIL
jgi:hypothetical protein